MTTVRDDRLLDEIVNALVEHLHPERVILFGSRARGDHHEDSDYDVIVVLDAMMTRVDAEREVRQSVYGRYPVDVILFTPAEYERKCTDVGTLAYVGAVEGVPLYERRRLAPRRVREELNEIPESVAEWIERAEVDFRTMLDLERNNGEPDPICFHAHESAEKFFKCMLVRMHVAPPRSHSLAKLVETAGAAADVSAREACAILDDVWPRSRYPGHPRPSADDARAAVAAANAIRNYVLRCLP